MQGTDSMHGMQQDSSGCQTKQKRMQLDWVLGNCTRACTNRKCVENQLMGTRASSMLTVYLCLRIC